MKVFTKEGLMIFEQGLNDKIVETQLQIKIEEQKGKDDIKHQYMTQFGRLKVNFVDFNVH